MLMLLADFFPKIAVNSVSGSDHLNNIKVITLGYLINEGERLINFGFVPTPGHKKTSVY